MPSTTVEIKGKDNTKKAFSSVEKSMERLKSSMGGLRGAVAGLAGLAGLGAVVTKLADVADEMGKTSARLGIGTKDLQKFRFAAEQSGMEVSTFDTALQRFTRRTSEAAHGTGVAKAALDEMGISVKDNDGKLKSNSDLLKEVADAFKNTTDQSERVRLAFKLFDTEGVKMINMLQQGSVAIDAMGNQLESVGGIITDKAITASEQFNDRLNIMTKAATNLLTPLIELVNKGLDPFFKATEKMAVPLKKQLRFVQGQINALIKERKTVKDVVHEFKILGKTIKFVTQRREIEVKNINKQINELVDLRTELKKQILAEDKQTAAKKKKIIQQKKENLLRKETNLELLHQNDILASQISMYSQGMTKIEESKNKLAAATAANIIQIKKEKEEKIEAEKAIQAAKVAGIKGTLTTMEGMASAVKDEGVELFRFWQAAALANIYMSTAEAITKAYAQLGPLFGSIAAGAMTVLGAAQARKVANLSPPKKEAGGDVLTGKTYLVGERGPELFTPGQMGAIAPNRNSNQEITVNIYDGTGRRISEYDSAIRVEIENRANRNNQFAALAA